MGSAVDIERRHLGCRVFTVVVRKFCKGQEVDTVILLVVDVDAEILFQDLVGALGLSIGLRVVRSTEVGSDTEEGTEQSPKA